jgi:septal ring factor EnvC (AmiA/AmiB activator)
MTTENWIALSAVLVTVFGGLCGAAYFIIKLSIKSAMDDAEKEHLRDEIERRNKEIERKDMKIDRLKNQIREMN